VKARSTIDLHAEHIGRGAVLAFVDGDPSRPIVLGCLHGTGHDLGAAAPEHVAVEADGERLLVTARERLVLRCGDASITLTRDGKVIVQGTYVSNQSSGVVRIKGGSVQIN
jgi:hypothetical protein